MEEKGGLPSNTAASLSYVLGFVSGLVFWATRKGDEFVRFHAVQSIGFSVISLAGWMVLTLIPLLGWVLLPFWGLVVFVFWLVAIVKAYQGERFLLPIVGERIQKLGKQLGL